MLSLSASRLCGCWNSAGWCWNSPCCHLAKEDPAYKEFVRFPAILSRVGKQRILFLLPSVHLFMLPIMGIASCEQIPLGAGSSDLDPFGLSYSVMSHQNSYVMFSWRRLGPFERHKAAHPSLTSPSARWGHSERIAVYQSGRPLPEVLQVSWSLSLPSLKNGEKLTYFGYKLPS